jgi:hypothetical protein
MNQPIIRRPKKTAQPATPPREVKPVKPTGIRLPNYKLLERPQF